MKGGMDFFKKMGEKGSSSLFGGMKVKGPSAGQKPKVAQTQTHLGSTVSEHSRSNEAPQKLTPTSQKPIEKQETKQIEKKSAAPKNEQISQQGHQQSSPKFELPLMEKPKAEKSQPSETKTKSQSKRSSEENEAQPIASIEVNPKSSQLIDHKSVSESVRKNSEKKESASESNYTFDKKKNRDRKQSNPFLNQIKKNTTMKVQSENQYDLDDTPKSANLSSELKLPKKSQKENVLEQINNGHIKSIEFILKQKEMKESIIQIAGNLQENRDQLTQSTQKQCECVEKEDYDEAENYQNKIENLQKKIEEQEIELEKRQEEYYKSEYEQLKQDREQHYESKKIVRQIKLAQLQLLEESSNLKRKKAEYEENENVKIDNQNKKITRLHNDIKFQSEQISEFQRKYKQDLNSRKDPLTAQLNVSQNLKAKLEEEIEQLERQLKQKRENLKEVSLKVTAIKKEIKGVDENFKEEGVKLQERKKKLESLESQKKDLVQNVKALEKAKLQESDAINKKSQELEREAKNLTLMGNEIEAKEVSYEDKIEDRKVKVDTFIHNTNLLKQFESKHKEKRNKIKELEFKKANVAAEANSLEEKRASAKARIPKLEVQQKSLAEAKNFKAANMKKTQIKEAQEQIETMSKKIEECFTKQKQIQEQIAKLKNEEMNHVSEENEIRKNLAISQFKFNACKWEELKAELDWVHKFNGKEEIKKKYGDILAQHLQGLVEEIRYIGEQYGLDLDFLTGTKEQTAKEPEKKIENPIGKEAEKEKEVETAQSPAVNIEEQQNEDESNPNDQEKSHEPVQTEQKASIENKQPQKQSESEQEREQEPERNDMVDHGDIHEDNDDDGGYVPLQLD